MITGKMAVLHPFSNRPVVFEGQERAFSHNAMAAYYSASVHIPGGADGRSCMRKPSPSVRPSPSTEAAMQIWALEGPAAPHVAVHAQRPCLNVKDMEIRIAQ